MTRPRVLSFLLVLICFQGSLTAADEPRVTVGWGYDASHPPRRTPWIIARDLDRAKLAALAARNPAPSEWNTIFAVFVLPESGKPPADQPPLSGRYHVTGNSLQFLPKYPLVHGMKLRARLDPRSLGGTREVVTDFTSDSILRPVRDEAHDPVTSIRQVYPSAEVLPENLLRFYVQFSHPMSRGEAYRHLRLLDGSGKPVNDPFLELDEELWSPDGRRFTLLFDPGRIKSGLKPREEVGPVLEEGKTYTLAIDRDWPDATGKPLTDPFRKTFRVGPPDMTPPDPANWTVSTPRGACLEPLEVRFPEPLDHALAVRLISVVGPNGKPVLGQAELSEDQTLWRFVPMSFWQTGKEYRLLVGTDLEDLAGNGIGRPFEVDAARSITPRIESATVTRPFRIGPAGR